jgi:NDP-sugar pyrophosphorylase family protein
MKNLSYLICSAGEGTRMSEVSNTTPKALLKLKGKTLLERSLMSLPVQPGDEIVFLHRLKGAHFSQAEEILNQFAKNHRAQARSVQLDRLTKGQAETAYLAKDSIQNSRIAIYNTDTFFQSHPLLLALRDFDYDGIAPCFKAPGEQWSFFKTLDEGPNFKVIDVKEKERISDWCSTGFYYFKDADLFFSEVTRQLENITTQKELYVAPFYSRLLSQGLDVRVVDCDEFKPMGTPEQVKAFWGLDFSEFKKENNP